MERIERVRGRAAVRGCVAFAGFITAVAGVVPTALAGGGAEFIPLGYLPGTITQSGAWGVSHDGTVVGGSVQTLGQGWRGFRWTEEGGMVALEPLPGKQTSSAGFISGDGSLIGGRSVVGCCTTFSTLWDADGVPIDIGPNVSGGTTDTDHVLGISGDGATVVGQSATGLPDTGAYHGYRWTAAEGMQSVFPADQHENFYGSASGASHDGSVIAGWYRPSGAGTMSAYRWTVSDGFEHLGTLVAGNAQTRGVSPDGRVVFGDSSTSTAGRTPFRWTEEDGMQIIDWHRDQDGSALNTVPLASNEDGTVFVGYAMLWTGSWLHEAVIYDEDNGFRSIMQMLFEDHGIELPGWWLLEARDISPDGRFIVGEGTNPGGNREAFLIRLPGAADPGCNPADLAEPFGVLDIFDVLEFLSLFEAEDPRADLAEPFGTFDIFDVLEFLAVFEQGCP